jgi:hypothetical protein
MKKIFFILLFLLFNFLFSNSVYAISAGNATDQLNYALTDIINPATPTALFLFAYYKPNGDFIVSTPAGDTAGYLINNNANFGDGQNIRLYMLIKMT